MGVHGISLLNSTVSYGTVSINYLQHNPNIIDEPFAQLTN